MFDRVLHHQDIKIFALFKYIRTRRMIARPTNLSKPEKPWEKSHTYPQISQITHFTAHVSVSRVSKHLSTPLPCRRLGTSSKTLLKRVVYIHGPSGSWLISKQLKKGVQTVHLFPGTNQQNCPFSENSNSACQDNFKNKYFCHIETKTSLITCMPCEAKSRASGFDRSLAMCISLSSVCLVFCQRGSGWFCCSSRGTGGCARGHWHSVSN